jgi:RimJ/RimL family protein N-acetyltransferase
MSEIIFQDNSCNLLIRRNSTYAPEFLALLERTIWGSGGLQYSINGMAEILNRIHHPHFLTLEENGQPIGVLNLIQKITRLRGQDYPAVYSYGLAIDAAQQGKGYGTLLAAQALHYGLKIIGEKGIYYGYVESDNIHSLKAIQKVGRKSLGLYHSLIISRFNPKPDNYLANLPESEKDKLIQLLYKLYDNHSLVDFEQSVKAEDYYVLTQGDEIIAGLQCAKNHLTIKYLPGAGGFFVLKLMPHIPILRSLLPEGNFHFLALGNIYVKAGYEPQLFKLIEAVLAKYQCNFGMIYQDKRSPVYQRLEQAGKFGLFNSLVHVPVQVMAYVQGFTEADVAAIHGQPLFISIMDPV